MKKQKLVAVQVETAGTSPSIVPVGGGTLEEILASWRIVQIQPLSAPPGSGFEGRYHALLLLEESPEEGGLGRLGFGIE